ncbi:hypothetical protein Brsp07_05302 [Brucella sp. NBRC 14130]|uniref:mobilization protein n=1 Tax=Brucella sp. NBRC 14130 TaxID=3075483 RepID=UPI0030A9501C
MARRSIDERIAELEEQAKALRARKSQTDRANDTRRKVILGTLLLRDIEGGGEASKLLRGWLAKELPGHLTREHDRQIFAELLSEISKPDHA